MGPASPRVTPQPRGGRGGAGPGLWRPNADWQWEAHPVGPWRAQAGQPRQPGPAQPASGARVERQVHAGRGRGSRSRCPSGLRLLRASGTRRCGVAGARGGLRGTGAPQPASRTGAPHPEVAVRTGRPARCSSRARCRPRGPQGPQGLGRVACPAGCEAPGAARGRRSPRGAGRRPRLQLHVLAPTGARGHEPRRRRGGLPSDGGGVPRPVTAAVRCRRPPAPAPCPRQSVLRGPRRVRP